MKSFKEQLKERRLELGLKQEQLLTTETSRISLTTIRNLESGRKNNPGVFVIKHLQEVLDFKFEI